jgi:hypothetical protein
MNIEVKNVNTNNLMELVDNLKYSKFIDTYIKDLIQSRNVHTYFIPENFIVHVKEHTYEIIKNGKVMIDSMIVNDTEPNSLSVITKEIVSITTKSERQIDSNNITISGDLGNYELIITVS